MPSVPNLPLQFDKLCVARPSREANCLREVRKFILFAISEGQLPYSQGPVIMQFGIVYTFILDCKYLEDVQINTHIQSGRLYTISFPVVLLHVSALNNSRQLNAQKAQKGKVYLFLSMP